ncbi:CASP C terminal-domain-containing protein [Amanita rubescens]|nr:CASP C terminal-domain-containing protein [Amanita rubescens]
MAAKDYNFSGALATWKDINLSDFQKTLDSQSIEIVDNQKESVLSRKTLLEQTKEFKKISDAEKLVAFKGLLKAYQIEIDNLTKRSKASENAFLNAYKILAEAPDPYPLLEAAVDQTIKVAEATEHEAELQRLREENTELRKRISDVASVESNKRKLEVKVEQLEHKMEDMIQEKVVQRENELKATYDERLRNYGEREQDLHRQVELTRNQLKDLRMSHESNQAKLLDQSQRQDQEVIAKLAEMDMLVSDLERANSRVATVERRNELLRAEIEAIRSGNQASSRVESLESQVAELEDEVERLSASLETQKLATSEVQTLGNRKVEEILRDVTKKVADIEHLKTRLKHYSDYEEIKRELDILKSVEFSGFDDDAEEGEQLNGHASEEHRLIPDKANGQQSRSLEFLLATKNKRISEELTKIRILYGELEVALQSTQEKLETTNLELEKQKALNEKLEIDLLSMNAANTEIASDPGRDLLTGLERSKKSAESSTRSTPIPFTSAADTSILPIVTSQRDRFRQRNAELEDELRKQFQVISDLRTEIKNLQADNLKLYEKVRYMQSYREEAGSRPPTSQLDPLPAPSPARPDDMSKYHARYEQSMNPFEAFRGREATRAYQSLNPVERGVLVLTRSILGNRRARTFFVFYAIALHLLVIYTTYECSSQSGNRLQKQPGVYTS